MKHCTHCGAELAPEETVCPACGQAVTDDTFAKTQEPQPEEESCAAETSAEETESAKPTQEPASESAPAEEAQMPEASTPEKKKTSPWLWVAGALAVVAIVAAILIVGNKDRKQDADAPADASVTETANGEQAPVKHTTADGFVSYTATQDQLTDDTLALSVASCGDKTLTNHMLNLYYWQQYYTFANNYGMYLSYLIDSTKGLDEQTYNDEETWQQAFLTASADMFHSITALNLAADEAGFTLSEEDEQSIAAIPEQLDAMASANGLESGLDVLHATFGPAVTMDDYVAFARDNQRATAYLQTLIDEMELTDQEISDYYDQNADSYAQSRVEKIDKPMVDVRHILVTPAEQDENGEYTEAAWQEAEQKAQQLLDSWKSGEATEESFAALANENSEDPGSSTNGGLYEDVYPGQMVDAFDVWCFDDTRQSGDTGIVKTDYGYHVMYFVGRGEEIFWVETVRGDLLSERAAELENTLREQYPMDLTLDNAAIFDVLAESREQAAAEAAQEEADASGETETAGEDAASSNENTQTETAE